MRLSKTEFDRLSELNAGKNTHPGIQKKTTADLRLFGFVDFQGERLSSKGTGRVVEPGTAVVTEAGKRVLEHFAK